MLRGYSRFENPPTTMTDVRTSNIPGVTVKLMPDGATARVGVMEVRGSVLLRCSRAVLILGLAFHLMGCALFVNRSTPKQEQAQRTESQLQLRVMRFADGYGDAVSRACAQAQSEATDSRLRYRLADFQVKQATAAVQIAAGSSPNINAVDMVVLASLTRTRVEDRPARQQATARIDVRHPGSLGDRIEIAVRLLDPDDVGISRADRLAYLCKAHLLAAIPDVEAHHAQGHGLVDQRGLCKRYGRQAERQQRRGAQQRAGTPGSKYAAHGGCVSRRRLRVVSGS